MISAPAPLPLSSRARPFESVRIQPLARLRGAHARLD